MVDMACEITRRAFAPELIGVAAVGRFSISAVLHQGRTADELDMIQKEIDGLPNAEFVDFVHGANLVEDHSRMSDAECKAMYGRYPRNDSDAV